MKKPSKKAEEKIKHSPVLVYTKPVSSEPQVDHEQETIDELNEAIADLATEVGGKEKQGSPIYTATARVQQAIRDFTEAHTK